VAEVTTEAGDEGGSMLERYLTQSTLVTPTDEFGGANASGVTLLTVHMAKGLEWPVVALAGLEDGLFPLARSAGEPGGLEEERRLCYVGLTRARERLYLSWARTRYRNGRLELAEPSRFLDAVPHGVVEERSTTPSWSRGGMVSGRSAGAGRARWRRVEEPEVVFDDDASQDAPRYARGERVRHRKFGGGVVREVSGAGRNLKVTVEFDDSDVGTKQLLVAYAALERDWEGDSA
jgi:DNA helicase-2/ATP-dependent DNA helicase PcrA